MANKNNYDVIVVGGGPSGMMAAGRAAESGARVLLLEKNSQLGRKLLITGKGRCNFTTGINDSRLLTKQYGANGKFLFSAFHHFGVDETLSLFARLGLRYKEERGHRYFPESDRSYDVLAALQKYLAQGKVEVKLKTEIKKLKVGKDAKKRILGVETIDGKKFTAQNYIIATGGLSYPETGSTGDGFDFARRVGHLVAPLRPSLSPITVRERWVKDLEGLSLKNVKISLWEKDKKAAEEMGEAVFTAHGLSGPIILDLSRVLGALLEKYKGEKLNLFLKIDFKPALDELTLDKRILRDFDDEKNKKFKNSLDKLLPQKLIPVVIELSKIAPEQPVNSVTREERRQLLRLLKSMTFTVGGIGGYDDAIVTAGGVAIDEIDQRSMRSKKIANLFFVGELVDLDGPTGGFNLQVCWSTGYLAGEVAANKEIAEN